MAILKFLGEHPYYIPFILVNIYVVHVVIMQVITGDFGKDDEDEDGYDPPPSDDPELDLPPGVTLPKEPELVES